MKHFIVYDRTGRILRTGSCQPHMVSLQAGPGEYAIEGVASDLLHCVLDGQVMTKEAARAQGWTG